MPQRVALFDGWVVPVVAGPLSMDLVLVATRDTRGVCRRVWRVAGARCDGGDE